MLAAQAFFGEMTAHSWQAQFNLDFLVHLILLWLWVGWRENFSLAGSLLGLACFIFGGLFSFIYIFALSVIHKGDVKKMLLGGGHAENNTL